jgi:NAD-dependent SIR2 family protein deacetylase
MTSDLFKNALQHAIQGNALLFLGAGFSTLFKDIKSRPLPIGSQLAEEMIEECKGKPTKDLRVAAARLFKAVGNEAYINFLQERFTIRVENESMEKATKIANEKWTRIYTTNFDDGYEKAAAQAGRKVMSAIVSDNIDEYSKNPRTCIHIHGFIDKTKNINADLVITLQSYSKVKLR